MNSKFRFSRCNKCYQSTLVLAVESQRVCKDCNPKLWQAEAEAEKEAWLKGDVKTTAR